MACINPHLHYPPAAELARQVGLGAVACKIHPVHGGLDPGDRMLYPAYAWAEEHRLPVIVHCGTSTFAGSTQAYGDPALLDPVFRDFPGLTVVLAHGGRGWWYERAAFLALMRPGADNGKEKTIYAGTAILQKPAWMPDSEHLVFIFHDVSSDWNGQVGEVAISAGKLHRITNDLNSYSNLTLGVTKDGKQLVAIQITPQSAIYTMSSDPNGSATAKEIDNHGDVRVGWLPDGRLLALDFDGHISVMNADGSNRSILYQEHLPMFGLSVCRDGANALFSMPNKQTKAINVFGLDLQSGAVTDLTKGTVDQTPTCSPDSKSFLYTSLVKGKRLLMEMPISGGEPKQLSDQIVQFGVFSPDGQQIAALISQGNGVNFRSMIEILPAQGGLPVKTFPPITAISDVFQYSADGKSLYYPVTAKGVSNILSQPVGIETVLPQTNFDDLLIYGYDYDWKNKRLAIARGRSNTDVVLLTQQQVQ